MVERLPAEKLQLCRGLGVPLGLRRRATPRASRRLARRWGAALSLWVANVGVAAQPATPPASAVVVSSTLERIVAPSAEGSPDEVRITSATVGSHADQLIFSVRFTNVSESIIDTVRITSPIPPDVAYVASSANGPGSEVLYSVDNGRTFGRPEELELRAANGGKRAAAAADYTHVRWVLNAPLDPGATGIARFRAVPR